MDVSYRMIQAFGVLGLARKIIKPRVKHLMHSDEVAERTGKDESVIPDQPGLPADEETTLAPGAADDAQAPVPGETQSSEMQ
jgi:hypothetical protein